MTMTQITFKQSFKNYRILVSLSFILIGSFS